MPGGGSVDRMVIGWMKFSYSTPSTMYMVITEARQQQRLIGEHVLEGRRRPLECGDELAGQLDFLLRLPGWLFHFPTPRECPAPG